MYLKFKDRDKYYAKFNRANTNLLLPPTGAYAKSVIF